MKVFDKSDFTPGKGIFLLMGAALFVLPMGTSPFTIAALLALALWIFSGEFFRGKDAYLREPWLLPVIALVLLAWIGLTYTPDPQGQGFNLAKKSYYWLFALMAAGVALTDRRPEILIRALLAGLLVNALIGFLQLLKVVPTFYKDRCAGLSSGYNTLAILLILGVIMASFYFREARSGREKAAWFVLMLSYFVHLIILRGRGGYLTFALLSPMVVINLSGGRRLVNTLLIYVLLAGMMALSPFVRERVVESIEDVRVQFQSDRKIAWGKQYSEDENLQRIDRVYMWRWAFDLFLEHPLTGVGTGGFSRSVLDRGGGRGVAHPHNNFLYMAVSFGIPGVLALGWFFWVLLERGWRNRRDPLGYFILSSGLVILIGGLTDTHIIDAGPAFLLAVVTGLQAAFSNSAGRRRIDIGHSWNKGGDS